MTKSRKRNAIVDHSTICSNKGVALAAWYDLALPRECGAGDPGGGPGPLEVEAAQAAVNVEYLAD